MSISKRGLTIILACCIGSVVSGAERESIFPLLRGMARGAELPAPYGMGLTAHMQDQQYILHKLNADIPGLTIDASAADNVDIQNDLTEYNVRMDVWVLPFLNVFGLLGNIDGETVVDIDIGIREQLTIDYDGVVYGTGVTLVGGWRRLFGSVTYTYTDTDLEAADSTVQAWVLSPRVGYSAQRASIWVGAMYQEAEEEHTGTISIPALSTGDISYDVGLEQKEAWNYLAGVSTRVWRSVDLQLEGGFGDRRHATISTSFRF